MGHQRLGPLPRTRKWVQVVALVEGGAGAAQVANATTAAAEAGLRAAGALAGVVGGRLRGLFDATPDDARREFARLATSGRFGPFARDFFARFVRKALDSFLSKALPAQVGEGKRFPTLARHAEFEAALDAHCREAAKVVEAYAGDWLSKENWVTGGEVTREAVAGFTAYAMTKLTDELRPPPPTDGP
jgi:hypothetical protein